MIRAVPMIRSGAALSAVVALAVGPIGVIEPAEGADEIEISAMVTDSAGKPVGDAVVFIYEIPGAKFKPPAAPAVMDQIDRELAPHMLPILAGTSVIFPNKDNIHHQVYSLSPAKRFEISLYKGIPAKPILFDKPGVVKLGCNIHDWMSGVIFVLPNPYFAKTDASGAAKIQVPRKRGIEIAVYHERLKGAVEATKKQVPEAPDGAAKLSWALGLRPESIRRQSKFETSY